MSKYTQLLLWWGSAWQYKFIKCCPLICIPIPRRQLLPISSWTRSTTGSTEAIVQTTTDAALLSAAAWATLNGLLRLLVSMLLRWDFDSTWQYCTFSLSQNDDMSVQIAGGAEVCVQGEGRLHLRLLHPLPFRHPWLHRLLRMHHLYPVCSNDRNICNAGYENMKW